MLPTHPPTAVDPCSVRNPELVWLHWTVQLLSWVADSLQVHPIVSNPAPPRLYFHNPEAHTIYQDIRNDIAESAIPARAFSNTSALSNTYHSGPQSRTRGPLPHRAQRQGPLNHGLPPLPRARTTSFYNITTPVRARSRAPPPVNTSSTPWTTSTRSSSLEQDIHAFRSYMENIPGVLINAPLRVQSLFIAGFMSKALCHPLCISLKGFPGVVGAISFLPNRSGRT